MSVPILSQVIVQLEGLSLIHCFSTEYGYIIIQGALSVLLIDG